MLTKEQVMDDRQPDFKQLLPNCDGAEIRAISAWYASDFDRRVTELAEILRTEITEQLRSQFAGELERRVAGLQSQPQKDFAKELFEEIACVRKELQKKETELSRRMSEDVFPFADVLKLRSEASELSAYLRGLSFRAKDAEGC